MKILPIFCVIFFVWGATADSFSDLSKIEQLVSNELNFDNFSLAEIILQIIDRYRAVLNDAVKELLENQRHLVLTGIPPEIPVLDPFYIEDYLIDIQEPIIGFNGFKMRFTDTLLKGFYNYKIDQVNIRPLGLFGMVSISFDRIEMHGTHETNALFLGERLPINVQGSGPFTLVLNDLKASFFVEIEFNGRIRPNLKTAVTAYSITSAQTNFTGFGPLLQGNINTAISAAFPAIVAISNVNSNLWLNNEFIPAVNGVINDFGIIDIIGLIRTIIRNNAEAFDAEILDALYRFNEFKNNL